MLLEIIHLIFLCRQIFILFVSLWGSINQVPKVQIFNLPQGCPKVWLRLVTQTIRNNSNHCYFILQRWEYCKQLVLNDDYLKHGSHRCSQDGTEVMWVRSSRVSSSGVFFLKNCLTESAPTEFSVGQNSETRRQTLVNSSFSRTSDFWSQEISSAFLSVTKSYFFHDSPSSRLPEG